MAVSINSVYQKVLTIANKEQRGYVTPVQFNLLANQAQENIFSQYFYDLNQFYRVKGNDSNNADQLEILKEKIALFESVNKGDFDIKPHLFYKVSDVVKRDTGVQVQHLTRKEYNLAKTNTLASPSSHNPVYTLQEDYIVNPTYSSAMEGNYSPWIIIDDGTVIDTGQDQTYQTINTEYDLYYIRRPKKVKWGYNLISSNEGKEAPLYNSNTSSDFELHHSEEPQLVNQLLQLVGIMIKDPTLYQTAAQEEMKKIQQEKQ